VSLGAVGTANGSERGAAALDGDSQQRLDVLRGEQGDQYHQYITIKFLRVTSDMMKVDLMNSSIVIYYFFPTHQYVRSY